MKQTKTLISILVRLMAFAFSAFVIFMPTKVYATDAVTNLRWDNGVAKWDTVDETYNYRVVLRVNNIIVLNESTPTSSMTRDFSAWFIPGNGYMFQVYVYDGEGNYIDNYSGPTYNVPGSRGSINNIVWSNNLLTWDAVENADGYNVMLKKDGVQIGEWVKKLTNSYYDFSTMIVDNGYGSYTAEVNAYKVDYTNILAEGNSQTKTYSNTSFVITFDSNGGNVNTASATTDADGKLTSLPTATREAYVFDGWFTEVTGGDLVDTNTVFTASKSIYAHWTQIVYFTVEFNTNGGSSIADKQVEADTKVDKPIDPTRSSDKDYDYTFAGWYSDSGLTTAFDFDTLINADTVIYAKWDKKAKTGSGGSSSGKVNPTPTPGGTSDPKTDSGNQPGTDSGTGTTLTTVTAPGKVTLSKPKNNKRKTATISWKKTKADGYEVQIALKKNFKKGKQTKITTKTSVKFKKLKKGKTYYVRVRAYNLDGDKKVYSKKWSAVKKIIIKK